ncbi:MAG: pal [Gemmatimonadetes bacterium]|nr:pal [Gemmatimonadota bacterium]
MTARRMLVPALFALLAASPVLAQRAGTVEIGGFGQFVRMDAPWALQNGVGVGGSLGVFFAPRWELQGDGSFSSLKPEAPRTGSNLDYKTLDGRLQYNLPFGGKNGQPHHFILGIGAGGEWIGTERQFDVSPNAGVRFMFNRNVALKIDGVVEYVENPSDPRFAFLPVPGTVPKAARSTDVMIRVGLSFLLNNPAPAVAAPPVPVTQPINQDSINAARMRDSLDRLARLRQDSIDAANRARTDSINAANAARERSLAELRALLQAIVYFDFDKSNIRDDQRSTLDAMIPILQANTGIRIRIEGHTDNRGSDEYNQALGMRRANTAMRYLVSKGIDAGRIEVVSYGEERPAAQGDNEEAWAKNRRDEFVITAGGDMIIRPAP